MRAVKIAIWRIGRSFSHASRTLRRNPGFSAIAILSIALGIGANTAVFTVADPLLFEPLPVPEPDRLVVLGRINPDRPDARSSQVPYTLFETIRAAGGAFEDSFIRGFSGGHLMKTGETEKQVRTVAVSGGYFSTLQVDAALGRVFRSEDEQADAPVVVVISHRLWQGTFGEAPDILGAEVVLQNPPAFDSLPVTIIGVAPEEFRGVNVDEDPDLWIPLSKLAEVDLGLRIAIEYSPDRFGVGMMARLTPGATLAQAQAQVDVVGRRVESGMDALARGLYVEPAASGYSALRAEFVEPLGVLAGAVAAVLAIACANVGALVLARGADQRRTTGVRLALGGGRWAVAGPVLAESVLLAGIGAALGLLLSHWGSRALLAYLPPDSEFLVRAGIDLRVLAFAAVALVASVLLFAIGAVLHAARLDPATILKDQSHRAGRSRDTVRSNKVIVAAQVGFATLLVIVAGVFIRTLQNLHSVETGFDRNVVQFSIDVPTGQEIEDFGDLAADLLGRLDALPEVESSAVYNWFGLLSGNNPRSSVQAIPGAPGVEPYRFFAGPDFFETFRMPILAGRAFRPDDEFPGDGPSPVLVSDSLARTLFGDANPVGRGLVFDEDEAVEVIGVAADVAHSGLREGSGPTIYRFFSPSGPTNARFAVRTAGNPRALFPIIRSIVAEIDSRLLMLNMGTMDDVIERTLVRERFLAQLTGAFGLVAMLLTAVGVYGVLSYGVARRRSEIGIRVALGATRSGVAGLILRETVPIVSAGILLGVGAALWINRLIAGLLYGVRTADVPTIAAAIVVMGGTAAAAAFVPAWRAAGIDPNETLREE